MYEKTQIEKRKRDLIKDLKCEIKESISQEKENVEIEAGNELETKYTALLVEVERLRTELDKRDQRINNLIDSIKIKIYQRKVHYIHLKVTTLVLLIPLQTIMTTTL